MAGGGSARRYAQAIFELAREKGQSYEDWLRDLRSIEAALGDAEVHAMLSAPKIPFERKREIIDRALAGLEATRRHLVYVLVERQRTELLPQIVQQLNRLVNEQLGIAEATITTAVPISDTQASQIAAQLEQLVGKKIVLERKIDPSILGGLVARVGDTLINGSVAGRLEALRAQIA